MEKQKLKNGQMHTFLIGVKNFKRLFLRSFSRVTGPTLKAFNSRTSDRISMKLGRNVHHTLGYKNLATDF